MFDYIWKAAVTWFIGFAPQFEVYIAVPAGIAMGMDYFSAVLWAVIGNFTAVPIVLTFFAQIRRISWLSNLIDRRYSEKNQERLNRYGPWFVVLATPMVGIWIVAVMARIAGMNHAVLLVSSLVSIIFYGVLVAVLLHFGIAFFT